MITIGFSTRNINQDFVNMLTKTSGVSKPEVIPIENNGQYSLTEVYNKILKQSTNDIVVLCHDDIYFDSKNWGQKIFNHFKRNKDYGIIGVAGATFLPKTAKWWGDMSKMRGIVNHEHEGKKWESKYSASKGNELDDVVLVDGVFIAINKNKIKNNFNENINGFHFYDIDFSYRNFINDVKIGVMYDVRITHKSLGATNDEWEKNRESFSKEHENTLPIKVNKNLNITSPIKVLISCLFFKEYTGSEMYVYELAKELKKLNCDVTVLSDINGPLSKIAQQKGIKVLPFSSPPGYKLGDGKWGFSNQNGQQISQPNVWYNISQVDFDVIHTQHYPITEHICNLYPNIPKISTIHSEVIDLENPFKHESIKKYICIRPEIQTNIIENFNINKSNTDVIYNPIDNDRFNLKNIKDGNYVLFVGSIDYLRKNTIFDLVQYSESINKELWIVGENKSDYLDELLNFNHVKYFKSTNKVEKYVKECFETAGILLGRTTIEGWLCGKKGWIYDVDNLGNIKNKNLFDVPSDLSLFKSSDVAKKIKEEYIKIID